jgi:hypothetical protein
VQECQLGPDRAADVFPIKAIIEAGTNVSLGPDFPAASYVADNRPLNAIEQAVTRQLLGNRDMPLLGGEDARLSVAEAIRANTYGAAYGIGVYTPSTLRPATCSGASTPAVPRGTSRPSPRAPSTSAPPGWQAASSIIWEASVPSIGPPGRLGKSISGWSADPP